MSYFALVAGDSWLHTETALDADLVTRSESWAANRIDSEFFHWTRTAWVGASIPREIAEIGELLGTGRYLEMARGDGEALSGEMDPKLRLGLKLQEKGEAMIELVKSAGGPLDVTGEYRQAPNSVAAFDQITMEPT